MNQKDFTAFVLPFLRLLLLKNVNIISLACPWGYYGQNCASKCKDRCMGCNNINGLCDYGCSPGWKGQNCNIGIGNKKKLCSISLSCLIIGLLYNYVNLIQKNANKLSISWGFFIVH